MPDSKQVALDLVFKDDAVRADLGLAIAAVLAKPDTAYVALWALAETLWARGWDDREAHEAKTVPPPGGTLDER